MHNDDKFLFKVTFLTLAQTLRLVNISITIIKNCNVIKLFTIESNDKVTEN